MRSLNLTRGIAPGGAQGPAGMQLKRKSLSSQGDAAAGAEMPPANPGQAAGGDAATAAEGRARLCCDITRDRHRKLRLYAAMNDTTIVRVVERLIDEHCTA